MFIRAAFALALAAAACGAWAHAHGPATAEAPLTSVTPVPVLPKAPAVSPVLPVAQGAQGTAVPSFREQMQQVGSGDYRWYGLRVYSAVLWSAGGCAGDVYARPLFLELTYAMRLKGRDIARVSDEQMAAQGAGSPAQRAAWLAEMQRVFPDVRSGDTLGALYQPGAGLVFYAQGKELAALGDAQFARAFLDIWLGPRSSAPGLRDRLLRACGDGRAGAG